MKELSTPQTLELPKTRKPYLKPQVEQVRLVLEEAILGTGCKTTTASGSDDPCEVNFVNCVQAGS